MAKYTTLLPSLGSKRSGRMFDSDDLSRITVSFSGKSIALPDRRYIQIRLWTADSKPINSGGIWTHMLLDGTTHAVIVIASALTEDMAWDRVKKQAALVGISL